MHTGPEAPLPLYRQVEDEILSRIISGALAAGAMLPSEAELGAELGVSPGTARKALAELERRGVLERRQGKGTFVTTTTEERARFHFFRLRGPSGEELLPELVSETLARVRSTARDRAAFGADCRQVIAIRRVRSVPPGMRFAEHIRLPAALFPGLTERAPLPNALYALFQRAYGIAIARAEEDLSAVAATEEDAPLGVTPGTPLLAAERRAYDLSGRIVELRESRYPTEMHRYRIVLD